MASPKSSILVVEDEQIYRSLLEQTLSEQGFDVLTAANGEEALQTLTRSRVDLILSDVKMPKMDGYAFYQRVQETPTLQTVPFLFLTALADKSHVMKGLELGVDDYITKPVDVDSLLAAIRGKLKHASVVNRRVKEEVDRLKAEIIRTLSHEFKTPLNIITGVSSFLLNDSVAFEPAELTNLLSSIKKGGGQLNQLVDDFVETMNIETGTMQSFYETQKAPENLPGIVGDAAALQMRLAEEAGVSIDIALPDQLPAVVIARAHMQDVLSRLLERGVTVSPKGGTVKVSAEYSRGLLSMHIEDSGAALTPDQRARIFDKFSHSENDDKGNYSTGLSLFIAKRLSEINKCDLTCVSEEGKGTRFSLTFPS